MILKPKACKFDKTILCGVVNNVGHCPFSTSEHCKANNATNWFGMVSHAFGTLTLKMYRYNHLKIKMSVLSKNMCEGCRIIWANPLDECPICNYDERPKFICDDCGRIFYHNNEQCHKCEGKNIRKMTEKELEE